MKSRMEEYLNAAISGNTENLPKPISRIDFLLCELIKTLGESGASIEEVEKIVTDKVAEIVADAPKDFDTLKELSDWIYTHEESAAAMNTAIQSNAKSIENLTTNVSNKADSDYVYDKTTADNRFLGINDTASNSYRWGNILNEMGTQNDSDTWLLVLNKDRVQHKLSTDFAGSAVTDEKFANVRNDVAINRTTLGTQRKNLLKPTSSETRAGITYTVNQDGSVALTGRSTTGSTYNYFSIPITLKPGKYKVNGMPETSSNTTYRVDLRANESGGTAYGYGAKEFEVEFAETTTAYYMIRIDGSYKEELNGITFYPMIRYAGITDSTYEPYKESIDERLIENKSHAAVNRSTLGYQCKNLLKNTASTQTINGITFTVNADGTITAKGTATANATFKFATLTLKAGTYKYSGISIAPSTSTANMSIFRTSDWVGLCALAEKNSFTITADTKIECRAVIYSGYTANNVVFYPMLRYADILDDTYEPYQPSVQEQIAALEARIAALEV